MQTFTVGFEEDSFNEAATRARSPTAVGAEHHEQIVGADAISLLPKLVRTPTSRWPTRRWSRSAISELARRHVTDGADGDGGDEILAGYETHQAYYAHRAYQAYRDWFAAASFVRSSRLPGSYRKVSARNRLKRFVAAAELRLAATRTPRGASSFRLPTGAPAGADRGFAGRQSRRRRSLQAVVRTARTHDPLNQMLYVDSRVYLPADMLVKIDRMTMAHGLEAREPSLDYRVVELTANGAAGAETQADV